jgi:methylmalonyl-CoA mutase N-terminal domain/subunit
VGSEKQEASPRKARGKRKDSVTNETASGIPVEPCYGPDDLVGFDASRDLGKPGAFPFVRGIYGDMYRGRLWTMRQYAGFGTAEETNRRYRYLLSHGQTGLSVAFDLPTQLGYDSDHQMAAGEVGRTGVAVSSLRDMEVLFEEIPLDGVSTSMTINATAAPILAMYVALARRQGVPVASLRGTVQNDILKEYVARGNYIFPIVPSMSLVTDIFAYCRDYLPRWNTISISGYHMREAGATAVQEVAFTLANAIAYVEGAIARGLDVDEFGERVSFFFNAHSDFFEEIAKFRAARRLWATIMRDRFGATEERAQMLRFHTQTAGSTLTAAQPENNIVRVALQALSAVLGGTQSLHTNSFDEALCLPTEKAATIALRTQQIIAYESGVARTVDPLAGSYTIEVLTNEIEGRAGRYLEEVERLGGAVACVESGYFRQEIEESAYTRQQEIEEGRRTVVGLNAFETEEKVDTVLLRVDPEVRAHRIRELEELRRTRDNVLADRTLDALRKAAESDENVMPSLVAAADAYCTLGEMTDVLRQVFGIYEE